VDRAAHIDRQRVGVRLDLIKIDVDGFGEDRLAQNGIEDGRSLKRANDDAERILPPLVHPANRHPPAVDGKHRGKTSALSADRIAKLYTLRGRHRISVAR